MKIYGPWIKFDHDEDDEPTISLGELVAVTLLAAIAATVLVLLVP